MSSRILRIYLPVLWLLIYSPLINAGTPAPEGVNLYIISPADGEQAEVTLEFTQGAHPLQLILGDKDHIPFEPPIFSEKITVMVK
jgi:hypothetical protein